MPAPRLTLVPFLQKWDPLTRNLSLNILVTPIGDPRAPLAAAAPGAPVAPSFAGASITLVPHISTNAGQVPTLADTLGEPVTLPLTTPADQTSIFDGLADAFDITLPQPEFQRLATFTMRKYLPQSYRQAFNFVSPKTDLAVIDDSYFCALRCPPSAPTPGPAPSPDISWGEAFAMLLRQPFMARAAGLIHTVDLTIPDPFDGGWIFFSLEGSSDFAEQAAFDPDYLRLFSTRVPELTGDDRSVFTSVSFPVAADAAGQAAFGSLDDVFDEAIIYDDGFAKIVHARQPDTSDLPADDGEGVPLQIDPGIQLGWDDEDVLIGMNRGVGLNADGTTPPEAPSAVAGYRVDVRRAGELPWNTMCRIAAPSADFAGVSLGAIDQETNVEIHPSNIEGQYWAPSYFARWLGRSMVAPTDDEALLSNIERTGPLPYVGVGGDAVSLRYGNSYEFRVRMSDTTGGGPDDVDAPIRPAQAPIARHDMRRRITMRQANVDPLLTETTTTATPPPTQFQVTRPACGYPQAVFTGFPGAFEALRDIAAANLTAADADKRPVVVPDPDAIELEICVYVETPTFDPMGGRDGAELLSRTYRAFPALASLTAETPLDLTLNWVDVARLSDRSWPMESMPVGTTGAIDVPRARNVRISVRAVGQNNLTYFATPESRFGDSTELWPGFLRVPASAEDPIFEPLAEADAVISVLMQPDLVPNAPTRTAPSRNAPSPILAKRLASALDLPEEGGTLFSQPGRRAVFSCNGLKHHLSPDASSVALTNRSELAQTWITAVRVPIRRDWSWTGYAKPSFTVTRKMELVGSGEMSDQPLADVVMDHTVSLQTVELQPADRERTEIVILDTFEPPLAADGFPYEVELSYDVTAHFEAVADQQLHLKTRLPVATPPAIAPSVTSAGHALSPFAATPEYAETLNRQRLLWLEFAEDPRKDPRDVIYGRVVAQAPDPMLMPEWEPEADPPVLAGLDVDPETVRIIRPGQADDNAGLSAMQALIPSSDSPLHFALPLPTGLSQNSPELFGFFTYEFRVGHPRGTEAAPYWSTAQGRFGPPFVIEGVQFPPPQLDCKIRRNGPVWRLSALHAQPVIDGRRVQLTQPNTEIWFVLYGRAMQADGATRRNVQIALKRGVSNGPNPGAKPIQSEAVWSATEVQAALLQIGLPPDAPASVLAVELLPEPNGSFDDPLQADLGQVRILRSSRLIEVPADCCVV